MKTSVLILPRIEIPVSSIPQWDQFSQERQRELILALAALLLRLPQVQSLWEKENNHDQQR